MDELHPNWVSQDNRKFKKVSELIINFQFVVIQVASQNPFGQPGMHTIRRKLFWKLEEVFEREKMIAIVIITIFGIEYTSVSIFSNATS